MANFVRLHLDRDVPVWINLDAVRELHPCDPDEPGGQTQVVYGALPTASKDDDDRDFTWVDETPEQIKALAALSADRR